MMAEYLLYFKAIHIIGFVAWFAGLFYLVRMFVYHIEAMEMPQPEQDILKKQFNLMQWRVYKIIVNPAMMITLGCGIAMLVINPGYLYQGWMHVKLTLLILLLGYHIYCKKIIRSLEAGNRVMSSFQFRLFNEVPTLLLLGIVFLAVMRDSVSPISLFVGIFAFAILLFLLAKLYKSLRAKGKAI